MKSSIGLILLLFLASRMNFLAADDCTTGFSVVAPELAVPGKTTAVLVTLHGPASLQPLNVTLRLLPDPNGSGNGEQLVETTQEIKGHGILPLQVPAEIAGTFVLQTLVNCTETNKDSCELQTTSQMRLVGPVRDVIIRPARHAYRPGEIVSFWVLALDHDLQIATGTVGTVSVKDPAGTKVAFWDQVPLDEGVKAFSLPLTEFASIGRWMVEVDVDSIEFNAPVEVAPGVGGGFPDVAAAEEHYVELRFGREMRRRYKPGLPFAGKVEAMSTEKSVRVRVKVYDNTTSIYSQDIEITNGEGTFVVPAIMADSDVIALQAELVSVESKEIESHYVLAREPIRKWNSSSDCYLLIEGVEHTLQPEEEAHVAILSTCPCERDLHYVITTDGRVTDWAQRRYEDPVPAASASVGNVCRLNFSFNVRSVMAPVSQLLVYYITPQGEPVSDVISFDVKLLHRQVYVMMEDREWWLPGQPLDLEVIAEPSSFVCLLGGRSGGNNDIRFDPRISEERIPSSVTGEVDFLEAGVSFFQRQCIKHDSGMSAVSYRQRGSGAGPASNRRRPPESLVGGAPLDQLWLWKCFNYTSEIASSGLTITGPQEAGKWSLWALTVSNTDGLRFSSPVVLQVFRPLQAEFRLPQTLRVRETLEVDIKIGNNINSCMDITALLALSEGAQFLSNGLLYVTERLRLGPHGATSLVVRLLVTTPGLKNMTVEVNGYSSPSCEGSEGITNTSLAGAVVRSATVNVQPEGIVKTDTECAYFCANENMMISTADSFKYEWLGAPRNREGIVIELKAGASKRPGPVHIALANSHYPGDKMYRITVGDADNTVTWIGRGKHEYAVHLMSVDSPGILSQDQWRTFWVTWEKNSVAFGRGSSFHNDTLLKWKMDKKIKIQHVGFASSWGSLAEFRIWNFNDESGFSQVLHLDTPRSVVPGSETGELLISGGLALPTLPKRKPSAGLTDTLSSLTTLLTLQHLHDKANETLKLNALNALPGQIQNILSFRKIDNSFSEHQMLDSHTSTITILEILTKVQNHFSVDPELIQGIKKWVQLRQEDDGSFLPLHADLKYPPQNSTLEHIMEITAETVIALFEIGIENDGDADTLQKAKIFLENGLPKVTSSEAIAAVTLALVLARSATASWAVERLRNASTTEDGEFGWPHFVPKRDAADWLYESEAGRTLKEPLIATVGDYKASLYALATFCLIGDLKFAESVTRYLFYRSHMLDKHSELLYSAVKTFSKFDNLAEDEHRALTISLATSGMELTDTLELKTDRASTTTLRLPSLPTKVFVYATGAGCATVQGKTTYSTYSAKSKTALLEIWSGVSQEILPDRSSVEEIEGKSPMLKIRTCFQWKHDRPSGVLRLEVTLFSGFELTSAPPMIIDPKENMAEMQHGHNGNNLWFVFANVSSPCPICVQYLARSIYVISSLRPAHAKIYPANRQDLAAETFFHTNSDSVLLKDITDDDLITWFGKNSTTGSDFRPPYCCRNGCMETSSSNPILENVEDLSVTTYTINVDGNSINNLTEFRKMDRYLIEPAAIEANETQTEFNITQTNINHSDDLILQAKDIQENLIEDSVTQGTVKNETQLEKIVLGTSNPVGLSRKFVVKAEPSANSSVAEDVNSERITEGERLNNSEDESEKIYSNGVEKIITLEGSDEETAENITSSEKNWFYDKKVNGPNIIQLNITVLEDKIPSTPQPEEIKLKEFGGKVKDLGKKVGDLGDIIKSLEDKLKLYKDNAESKSSVKDIELVIQDLGERVESLGGKTNVLLAQKQEYKRNEFESSLRGLEHIVTVLTEKVRNLKLKSQFAAAEETLKYFEDVCEDIEEKVIGLRQKIKTFNLQTPVSSKDIEMKLVTVESVVRQLEESQYKYEENEENLDKIRDIEDRVKVLEEKLGEDGNLKVKKRIAGVMKKLQDFKEKCKVSRNASQLIHVNQTKYKNIKHGTEEEGDEQKLLKLEILTVASSTVDVQSSTTSLPQLQTTKYADNQLIVDLNVSPPKHINTQKLEIPQKLFETAPTTDEPTATFAPEMKNDKYVLLDKEELWGMLREVVSDEINKKVDGEKLRRQGFT